MTTTRQAAEKIGAMLAEDRTGRRLDSLDYYRYHWPVARPVAADVERRRSRDGSCCCRSFHLCRFI